MNAADDALIQQARNENPSSIVTKKIITPYKPAKDIPSWDYNDKRYNDIDVVISHIAQQLED